MCIALECSLINALSLVFSPTKFCKLYFSLSVWSKYIWVCFFAKFFYFFSTDFRKENLPVFGSTLNTFLFLWRPCSSSFFWGIPPPVFLCVAILALLGINTVVLITNLIIWITIVFHGGYWSCPGRDPGFLLAECFRVHLSRPAEEDGLRTPKF